MKEFVLRQEASSVNTVNVSVDSAVSGRFRKLVSGKGSKIAKLVLQKGVLTASALTIIMSSGCGNINTANVEESLPVSPPILENNSIYQDIVLDTEGFPVEYLSADGNINSFDLSEIKEIQQEAVNSGEPQILAMFPSENKTYYANSQRTDDNFLEKHPVLSDLPEDVLSEEELAANGVRIIQADNTILHIRKQAFEEGGPLAELANQHGSEKLTIVLVDAPLLARIFMKDKRYDEVRDIIPFSQENLEEYRLEKVKELQSKLVFLRDKSDKEENGSSGFFNEQLLFLKMEIYAYENSIITDEQLFMKKSSKSLGAVGKYFGGENYTDRTIFVAVGHENLGSTMKVFYFDANGKFGLASTVFHIGSGIDFTPNLNQSCPDPDGFYLNPEASSDDPGSRPYGAQSPGLTLGHEVKHDELIAQAVKEGRERNYSEYDTDTEAMQRIRDAWGKWEESGFTDNSGYYFVFSLPLEEGGGYILTRNPQANKIAEEV